MDLLRLAIIKPNKSSYSETFIQTHIDLLAGIKKVLYGGDFPLYRPDGKFLINNWWGILDYLFEKRILKKRDIAIRDRALARYLGQERIEVVLAEYGTVGATIAHACQLANVPLVIHFHGVDAHRYQLLADYRAVYQRAFTYASALIAVSGDMRDSLVQLGADPKKIHLIPYGVNTDLFQAVNPIQDLNFLCIGRLVDKKAPLLTIGAFAKVVQTFPSARLTMVGDGPLLSAAREKVRLLKLEDRVSFTGAITRDRILTLMKNSYAYIQHSVRAADGDMEGTPNTILEASAAGLPVVSTKHAGIKEAVIDEVTGFLVDEHDEEGMAQRMINLASSPSLAQSMGAAARKHMLRHYDIRQQIAKLDAVLNEAAKNYPA